MARTRRTARSGRRRYVPVVVSALVCGAVADAVLVLPFALSTQPSRLWFAAFGIGSIFAAIAAGWAGTLGTSDGTRSRLLVVVGISEAGAGVVATVGFLALRGPIYAPSALLPLLWMLYFGLGMTVVALAAGQAALRFRSVRQSLVPDLIATGGLLALAVILHTQTIILAPLPS